jgi:hypothetical protein
MPAGKYNFIIEQGATFTRVITWRDADDALVDLTNYTARMMVRALIGDASPIVDLTTENGGIALGGALGTVTLTITAAETTALGAPLNAVYDLEVIDSGGIVTRLLQGAVKIDGEVTR